MYALLLALSCTPKTAPAGVTEPAPPPKVEVEVAPDVAVEVEVAPEIEAECKALDDGRTACFPLEHVCTDPHGIGDGKPIVVDCWTSGGRMCHPSSEIWPVCAGGWLQES